MKHRKIQKFNINNKDHLAILRFIARWKYVSAQMIAQRWPQKNISTIRELLNLMSPSKSIVSTSNKKPKIIWYGQLRKVTDTSIKTGHPTYLYTVTWKGAKQANLPYHIEVSVRDKVKIGQHTLNCLKVINQLGLKENEYFTEPELWVRFKAFKTDQNMEIKPRMCDFAYIKDGKFIGVEIENHLKNYKEYVANNFDPRYGINILSTITKDKKKWGYFDGSSIYPTYFETKVNTLSSAQNEALKKGVSASIVKDKFKFGQIKKYKIYFDNQSEMTFDGISIEQLKQMLAHHEVFSRQKIVKAELLKNEDCIFYRLMYALNHKFYNEIHWYLPSGKEKLFEEFIEKAFYGGYDHSFFKVFSLPKEPKNDSPVDINLLTQKLY